jgi:hypothetical protein
VRDRFDYVAAISDSWKRQMLQNLLKIRYSDAPVFMDVTTVISTYSMEGEINGHGELARKGRGDTFVSAGFGAQYSDRPTITYQPLSGSKFARSMMTPIPVTGVLAMIQGGYPADIALRLCVNSINGIANDYGGQGNPRVGSPKFHELMTALKQAQSEGGPGFRIMKTKGEQSLMMFLHPSSLQEGTAGRRFRELLGLDLTAREFRVVYGSFPEPDAQIAIMTRSVFQVMIDLASQIDVPAADIAEGRVYNPQRTAEQQRMFPPLLAVHTSSSPPEDAFLAVRYRGQSFWIDDRDQQSKLMLSALMLLFSLTESVSTQAAPVVTIPAR